jgi:hypothetical protein
MLEEGLITLCIFQAVIVVQMTPVLDSACEGEGLREFTYGCELGKQLRKELSRAELMYEQLRYY